MWFLYGLVLLAGIANAVQPGLNTALGRALSQPILAGLISMLVGTLAFLAIGLVGGRLNPPSLDQAMQAPWWAWLGGLSGTALLLTQLFIAQRVGAAPFLGLLVTAGVVTSILLDHFGWVGFEQHPASLWRLVGGLLMIGGVILVAAS